MNWVSLSAQMQDERREGEAIGIAKGEAIGIAKGEAIGIEKNKLSTAKNLIRLGKLSLEDIASASGLSLEVVQKLSEEVLAEET